MTTVMKCIVKKSITNLWMLFLLTGLSLISVSSLSYAATPKIGDSYGGGIVFYIDNTGQHGLIVSKTSVTGHSSAKEEAVFTWYDANVVANAFVDGYSDWVLPNKEQLHQLYLNKNIVGGMLDTYYWSSSESDANNSWAEYFFDGKQVAGSKANGSCVRAVRAF
jgi:hypothetical protein